MADPRGLAPYKRLRARMRAARPQPCALCGGLIDYDAEAFTPWSFTVDHIWPIAHGGDGAAEWNAQPAHYRCNNRKQARPDVRLRAARQPRTSRAW